MNGSRLYCAELLQILLPLRSILAARFQINEVSCPFCNQVPETATHLFFTCHLAK
ncbi:hypothetical protein RHMOL_Rhmol04G0045800 [Rhododendron molle]|uniref:Uncharacterized protein n=1 Tax=Rhododendron molle TaxID=49168 RepID=A0ACC0NYM8_RHOML|nr:hypothetical protein RHMOL_Rhmol04G0045800 [Rhododendron molle]